MKSEYASTHTVDLIPGDGIVPEMTRASCTVLDAAADRIREAYDEVIRGDKAEELTPDIGDMGTTTAFAKAIVNRLG